MGVSTYYRRSKGRDFHNYISILYIYMNVEAKMTTQMTRGTDH